MKEKKLLIIQPYLTRYRIPVFLTLKKSYDLTVVASESDSFGQFDDVEKRELNVCISETKSFFGGKLFWQSKVLSMLFKRKPNKVFVAANPRYLSSWCLLLLAKLTRKQIYLHGQGRYNKTDLTALQKTQYWLYEKLCHRYICYTEYCQRSLLATAIYPKTVVAENSITNKCPISTRNSFELGILYIGRLREQCNLELLLSAVEQINKRGSLKVKLHVIGEGNELESFQKAQSEHEEFYGELYDQGLIRDIASKCFAGCYPGDAGLSILHYMSLSLVPIVHDKMAQHMGPEPSYITHKHNGMLFKRDDLASLVETIDWLLNNKVLAAKMQVRAFDSYHQLTNPSLGQRLSTILNS
ncbi:glycosyltransferase family 4 protein [Colwellia sp. MEBiC06753]